MATEQEELRLTVTLIDNASAGLDKLRDSLKEIGGGSGGSNKHLEKFTEQNKAVTETVKKMTGEMGEAFKSLGMLRLGFAGGAAGLALFGFEMTKQIAAVVEFADKIRALNQQARQFGISPAQLKNVTEQLQAFGISGETAVASIGAVSAKIAELQRTGSQLRLDLMRQAGHDPEAIRNMEQYLDRLTHARDITEQLNIIRQGGEQVFNNARRQGYGEQEAANRRNNFWQMQGYNAQLANAGVLEKLSEEEKKIAAERQKNAEALSNQMGQIERKWNDIVEASKQPMLENLKSVLEYIEPILDKLKLFMEWWGKHDVDASKLGGIGSKITPLDPRKETQENTDATKKLTDELRKANENYVPMSYSGGGIGGGGGGIIPAAFHPPSGAPMFGGGGGRWGNAEFPNLGSAGQVPQSMARGGGGGGAPYGSDTGGATGTGSSGPAGDPSVPSDVLERAKAVALHSGPGGVEQFMASQGYPKAGNWCGEFAASVVKSAGGTPPKNPAIASNWRNWGSAVEGAPQPGDVAVRRGARTGSTGSHVTFVEGFDPKNGRFTGVGGNQGRPESSFAANEYEFRRGGTPNGAQAGGGAVNSAISSTAGTAGMDEAHWKAIAGIESSLDPSSNANKSTQYKGLFQIGTRGADSEWARRGQGSPYDPQANAEAAAKLASDNNAWFKGKYGRDPTPTETYMMHQQGRGFYSRGTMTNIGNNKYPGMRGPQTHESFEAGWGREIERRAARNQLDGSQVASTKVEGTGKLTVDVNAPKGTNVGAEGGGLFKKVEMNRQTQMSPARRGPEGGYATESML
jgi:uncharacterized protein (TIGR02594 family)